MEENAPRPDARADETPWPPTNWPAGPIKPPAAPLPSRTPEPRRRRDGWTIVLSLLGGVLLGTGVTLGVLGITGVLEPQVTAVPATTQTTTTTTSPPPLVASGVTPSAIEVASAAIPSIVAVEVRTNTGQVGGGSGVVYGDAGFLITNHHVIADASEVFVVFADGIGYAAEVVGSDPLTDIAVLSTTRTDLAPIRLGAASDLVIGERAVAVGNPLGLRGGPSVTTGILSATGRSLLVEADRELYGLLQTDAPITRGSSGGALLDQEAKLIGITTAIGVSDVGAEGLGFAVPVDMAVSVADDLIADGDVRHGLLGITGTTVTETRDDASVPLGVGVTTLSPDSAYADAGGETEDVIVQLDGDPVTSIEGLIARLRMRRAGDEVVVNVLRDDEELIFEVELTERIE